MKGKQSLKQIRAKKGDARTEHGEQKQRCNLSLTPTAIASIDIKATKQGISRSEAVEQWARGRQSKLAVDLLHKLEAIPRSPERWDGKTKAKIYYGLEEAIVMVLDLIDLMPCGEEDDEVNGKISQFDS